MTPSTDYRLIPLTQGQSAIVDADNFEWLMGWKWHARWCIFTKGFYAQRRESHSGPLVHMHRVILDATIGLDVDHVNLNTLDNRRGNLRLATRAQNSWNRSIRSDNTSGYKGVSFRPEMNLWRVRIMTNGKRITVGYYPSVMDAHAAYCAAAAELHGEFARVS